MLQTSARLLRLLSLFQAKRYWSGADLCQRLEVTDRTLRRDVDRLRSLGYPVHSTSGAAGGYQLGSGAALPPLLLDDEEAVAVAVGLRTAATGSVAGIEESSVRALAKLEQVLPSRLRRRVAALNSFIVPLSKSGPTVDAGLLAALAASCRDHEVAGFSYRDHSGVESSRTVEPHRLVPTGFRWYLVAWDLVREDWRTFRVDRMGTKLTRGARFVGRQPPEGGYAAYVARSVSVGPHARQARVLLLAPLAKMAELIPPTFGGLEIVDDSSCLLITGAHSLAALAIHLALLGADFRILEPEELREQVLDLAARLGRAGQ
ncbi:YafY family protein [uncultured Paludibaculum sp.]|uniref:helix-turn-helix transcriptional regulator n=1 Tax=uncultured Paludibaculum sp. TaxID=1765020 RepID=UPI002AAA6CAA|nr:YafY family protein [uncultured Paludibaculum sp.]